MNLEQPPEQPPPQIAVEISTTFCFYVVESNGGRGRDRTYDQSIKSRMLYQLSYASATAAASLGEGNRAMRPGGARPANHRRLEEDSTGRTVESGPRSRSCRRALTDEVDLGFVRDDAALEAHLQQLADGFAAVFAVVQGALVDVHADKLVGERGVEVAGELHGVGERLLAVGEGVLDAVTQGIRRGQHGFAP